MHKDRFDALDGMRGVAALAVLVYHISGHRLFPGAWVAVDLFFVLSGFVIHHSYHRKLQAGMGFRTFMLLRLIRLAPLYLLGLLVGVFTYMADKPHAHVADVAVLAVQGALFIPDVSSMPWPFDQAGGTLPRTLFPLNGPSWTLFFELAVNMLFFVVGARWLQRGGQHVLLLGLLALAGFTLLSGEFNAGWSTRGMLLALMRVSTGFFLGVLIYQQRHRFPGFSPAQRGAGVALFFLVTLLPSKAVALANALMLAPVALALAADLELSGRWRRLATLLGEWSYPLYITHAPLQRGLMSLEAIQTLGLLPRVALICTVCIAFAWLANMLDIRARRWLTGRLQPPRSRVAVA